MIYTKKKAEKYISDLNQAILDEVPLRFAELFSEMEFAAKANLIDSNWRRRVDVQKGFRMLKSKNDYFVGTWLEYHRMLRQILEYTGGFSWQEVMQVLGLRSSLESTWRLIPDQDKLIVKEHYSVDISYIDELLSNMLKKETAHASSCRGMKNLGFESLNPKYWWWQRNEP